MGSVFLRLDTEVNWLPMEAAPLKSIIPFIRRYLYRFKTLKPYYNVKLWMLICHYKAYKVTNSSISFIYLLWGLIFIFITQLIYISYKRSLWSQSVFASSISWDYGVLPSSTASTFWPFFALSCFSCEFTSSTNSYAIPPNTSTMANHWWMVIGWPKTKILNKMVKIFLTVEIKG